MSAEERAGDANAYSRLREVLQQHVGLLSPDSTRQLDQLISSSGSATNQDMEQQALLALLTAAASTSKLLCHELALAKERAAAAEQRAAAAKQQQRSDEARFFRLNEEYRLLLLHHLGCQVQNKYARVVLPGKFVDAIDAWHMTIDYTQSHPQRDEQCVCQIRQAYPRLSDGIELLRQVSVLAGYPRLSQWVGGCKAVTFTELQSVIDCHFKDDEKRSNATEVLRCLVYLSETLKEDLYVPTRK